MSIKLPDNFKVPPPDTRRSTFNLPDCTHKAIEELAKGLRISMKDLFSMLVSYPASGFALVENQEPKSRKTYVLTSDTLIKLHIHARANAISRDDLVVALIRNLVYRISQILNELSSVKKTEAAQRIEECAIKASYEWDKCSEDRELLEQYDPEFKSVAQYFGYIDLLNELPSYINEYISKVREAENENDETCN